MTAPISKAQRNKKEAKKETLGREKDQEITAAQKPRVFEEETS